MSGELLSAAAGMLLSLLFSYLPGLSDWYEPLDPTKKRLVMLAALLVVAAFIMANSCWGVALPAVPVVTCDGAGAGGLIQAFIAAAIGSQTAFLLAPKRAGE